MSATTQELTRDDQGCTDDSKDAVTCTVEELYLIAAIFNAGADARLAGIPIHEGPYAHRAFGSRPRQSWEAGWIYCHIHWGEAIEPGRRPMLPEVA